MTQKEFNSEVLATIRLLTEKVQQLQLQVNNQIITINYLENKVAQIDNLLNR